MRKNQTIDILSLTNGSKNREILDYPDGQKIIEFFESPDSRAKRYTEKQLDTLVPGRSEWTAITLAVLCRCDLLVMELSNHRNSKTHKPTPIYRLGKSIVNANNQQMIKDVVRFFEQNPNALVSTVYLCRKFLCQIDRMRSILFDLRYDGFIEEIVKDYYALPEKFIDIMPKVERLTSQLFGPEK